MALLNEIVQWVALLTTAFLLLGLYYQAARVNRRDGQPAGPPVGRALPAALFAEALRADRNGRGTVHLSEVPHNQRADALVIAFVTENCYGCRALVADLERGGSSGYVLGLHENSRAWARRLEDADLPVVVTSNEVWLELNIGVTPLQVVVDRSSGRVLSSEARHDVIELSEDEGRIRKR